MASATSLSARSAMPAVFAFSLQEVQSALHLRKRTSPFCVGLGADIWSFQLFPASQVYFPHQPHPLSYEFLNNRSSIDKAHIACSQFHIQQSYTKDKGHYRQISHHLQEQLTNAQHQTWNSGPLAPHLLCIYFENQGWQRQDQQRLW